MCIIMLCWIIITLMLYQTYQEGKNNNVVRLSYRQSKCSSCKQYNSSCHRCNLEKNFSSCYSWEKKRGW